MRIFLLIFALINVIRGQGGLGVNIMDFMGPNGVDLVGFQKAMEEAAARLAQESAQAAAQETVLLKAQYKLAREEERKSSEAAIEEAEKRTRDEERLKAEKEKKAAVLAAKKEKEEALLAERIAAKKDKEAALEAERKEARRQRIIAIRKARAEERRAAAAAKTATSTTTSTTTITTSTTTSTTSTTSTTTTTRKATTTTTTTTKRPTTRAQSRNTRKPVTRSALVKLDPEIFGKYRYCRKCVGETAEQCIKANRLETCRNPAMTCYVNYRRVSGVSIFKSGCMKLNDCQNHERQNGFNGGGARNIYHMQCRPDFILPGRPSTCTFCHKMGTWERTHLLFQNDTVGTDDPESILGYSSFKDIFSHPLREIRPNNVLSKQKWYMNAPPSF